ncbi:alpha/beta fold hydrolase [Vibrio sp. F74]|uniref:alpha/beta fold hydrolase n=1 Tax=Vibrio sp. F74 TaxID=700020 RepID=UPI0035F57073
MTTFKSDIISRVSYKINGADLSVLQAGKAGNPVALLIHGIPASALLWTNVIEALSARGYFVVAPDLPGFGETIVADKNQYGIQASSDLLNDWIIAQGWQDIWLVAHDIGGGVAQGLLVANEAAFQKATISNAITADTWPVPAIQGLIDAANADQFELAAEAGIIADQLGPVVRSTFVNQQQITNEVLDTVFLDSKLNTEKGRVKFAHLLCSLTNKDTLANMEALKKVNLPVNLIWAMQDPNQPWTGPGSILSNTFKNVTVDKIDQAGHFLQIDAEEEYLKLLLG